MDELSYKHALVHPDLDNDPQGKQGHIGRISHVIYENDEAHVRFPGEVFGIYETDALLVLRPWQQVIENLRQGIDNMERSDIVDLLNVYLLQASRDPGAIEEAIGLAIFNDAIADKALISLRDWIDNGLSDDYNHGAEWEPGRGI